MIKMAIFTALTLVPLSLMVNYSAECVILHQSDNYWTTTTRSCDTITSFYLYGWIVFCGMMLIEVRKLKNEIKIDAIRHFIMENCIS